mmetsp:Transcript_6166/g.15197  ORF Transcript_6166/g.15197 Transcript_6166/m.15197 type:complete len:282 (+) Transcript_6166:2927-3772(+)
MQMVRALGKCLKFLNISPLLLPPLLLFSSRLRMKLLRCPKKKEKEKKGGKNHPSEDAKGQPRPLSSSFSLSLEHGDVASVFDIWKNQWGAVCSPFGNDWARREMERSWQSCLERTDALWTTQLYALGHRGDGAPCPRSPRRSEANPLRGYRKAEKQVLWTTVEDMYRQRRCCLQAWYQLAWVLRADPALRARVKECGGLLDQWKKDQQDALCSGSKTLAVTSLSSHDWARWSSVFDDTVQHLNATRSSSSSSLSSSFLPFRCFPPLAEDGADGTEEVNPSY